MNVLVFLLILFGVFASGYVVAYVIYSEDRDSAMYAQGFHDGYNKCLDDINYGKGRI